MKKILVKPKFENKFNKPASKVSTIQAMISPVLRVHKTHIVEPYFYPGSDIGRYGIVVEIDPEEASQASFLEELEEVATKQGVDTIGHTDDSMIFIKFQTKDPITICIEDPKEDEPPEVSLQGELPYGSKVVIEFDLNLYYNTKERKKGFNFCPKKVIVQADKKTIKLVDIDNVGASKNNRGRPKPKIDRSSSPELEQRNKRNLGDKLQRPRNTPKVQKA